MPSKSYIAFSDNEKDMRSSNNKDLRHKRFNTVKKKTKRRAKSQEGTLRSTPLKRISLSSTSTACENTVKLLNKKKFKSSKLGVKYNSKFYINFDEGVQRYYFKMKESDVKTWKLSRIEENKCFILMDSISLEVHEWQLTFHYVLKRYFFYNHDTKRSHWVLPLHEKYLKRQEKLELSSKILTKYMRHSLGLNESDNSSISSNDDEKDEIFKVKNEKEVIKKEIFEPKNMLRTYHSESLLAQMKIKVNNICYSDNEVDYESSWSLSDSE